MFPMAITTGNTYVIIPSERTPGAVSLLSKMLDECGIPKGVMNVV